MHLHEASSINVKIASWRELPKKREEVVFGPQQRQRGEEL
jgi:hypothetical protein